MTEDLARIVRRFEGAGEPTWLWDAGRHRILWANAKGRALWGADSLFDLAERGFAADGKEARAMAQPAPSVDVVLHPPGGAVWASLEITPLRITDLSKVRLVRVTHVAERPRHGSTALRSDLFLAAPAALALMDGAGHIIEANKAWRQLNDAPRLEAFVGEAPAARFLLDCMAQGRAQASFARGGRRVALKGLRATRGADTRTLIYVQAEDVTLRRALEHLLETRAAAAGEAGEAGDWDALTQALAEEKRKNEAKSDFLGRLSHEMRNPLNAIIGFSEIMQQHQFGPMGNARYENYIDDIRTSADHLLSLVNDLLDLARIEAGKLVLEFDGVALPSLIKECVRLLRPQATNFRVNLETMVPANLPQVMADARSLKQILINLISNALKFTGEGGTVRVAAEAHEDGSVLVSVTDTGVGMSRGEVQLAMEPFGQVDGPVQMRRKGTGLGLPVAKALTEANQAVFRIASEPKRGTKVEVLFPPARVLAG